MKLFRQRNDFVDTGVGFEGSTAPIHRAAAAVAMLLALGTGCSSSPPPSSGAAHAQLATNPSVSATCQMCLGQSSTNDCDEYAKVCGEDTNCMALNACVNKCASLNTSCIDNCGALVGTAVQNEWLSWWTCGCGDCASSCSVCGGSSTGSGGSGDSGAGGGSGMGSASGTGGGSGTGAHTCSADPSIPCENGSVGYICNGSDTPVEDGLSASCGTGVPDPEYVATDYCCD
jgi:hypothetical protein